MVEIFGRITYNGYNLRFQENGGCNMSGLDIGIDLGTTSIIIYLGNRGIVLPEPSVVARCV